MSEARTRKARVVVPCPDIEASLAFFERLGFLVDEVEPADDPAHIVVSAHGLRLELERGPATDTVVRIACDELANVAAGTTELAGPGGVRVELVEAEPPLEVPEAAPALTISRAGDADWHRGRAGMLYRELVPGRCGGRFVVSHIRIADGGPVPDYVHHHAVRFQMIYCYQGWVRLVYEDQGAPFVMEAGACVVQPPGICHRVLECSAGLEVVEISCPAAHSTRANRALILPSAAHRPERRFDGQRFLHGPSDEAPWQTWRAVGFERRDLGVASATDGLATAGIVRATGASAPAAWHHRGELLFLFVLTGGVRLQIAGVDEALGAADAVSLPVDTTCSLAGASPELTLLEVALPA